MVTAIKSALIIFILLGVALAAGGAWEIWNTMGMLTASTGKAKAQFAGYHRERSKVAPGVSLRGSGIPSISHYAEFNFRAKDGSTQTVREEKIHVFEIYKPGQEVDILLFPNFKPRLDGFYSLYVRDLLFLLSGIVLLLIPLSFWKYALPIVSGAGQHSADVTAAQDDIEKDFKLFLDQKIGSFSVKSIFVTSVAFMGIMLIAALIVALIPYISPMGFGAGSRLMEAINEERFDEARLMIEKGEGINAVNEFNQNPLLISLEAGRMDLAAMLIEAGADVNIKSKMLMTPLRVAAVAGNLSMVKLLLAKGALPQLPDDRLPPFHYAMVNGHDEIARLLLDAGTDLHKLYPLQSGKTATVGDLAIFADKKDLAYLIRSRGGTFTAQ